MPKEHRGSSHATVSCTERNPLTHHSVAPTRQGIERKRAVFFGDRIAQVNQALIWMLEPRHWGHIAAQDILCQKTFPCSDYPTATDKTRPASRGQRMGFLQEVNAGKRNTNLYTQPQKLKTGSLLRKTGEASPQQ